MPTSRRTGDADDGVQTREQRSGSSEVEVEPRKSSIGGRGWRCREARWQGRCRAGAWGDVVVVEQGELRGGPACTEVAARKRERKTEWRRWSGVEARVAGLGSRWLVFIEKRTTIIGRPIEGHGYVEAPICYRTKKTATGGGFGN
jgi:hypothetical protein